MTDTAALSGTPPAALLTPPGEPKTLPKAPDYSSFVSQVGDADKGFADTRASLEAKRDSLLPPDPPKPIPMPATHQTDPKQAWGSSAMVLAMLASGFTRKHFTTAMNAAAAVLNGYHKGDMEAADTAFKQWQVASENALKNQEYQNNTYLKLLGEIDREERLGEQAHTADLASIKAKMQAAAAAFGDQKMLWLLQNTDVKTAMAFTRDQVNNTIKMGKSQAQLEAEHVKWQAMHSALEELHKKPEYIAADPISRAAMDLKVVRQTQTEAAPLTQAQADHIASTLASQFNTQGIAKTYNEVQDKWPTVLQIERALKENGQVNAQQSAVLVDTFQRMYNNQAVRVGLVKLNTQHAPFIDKLELELSKFSPGGGGVLAPNQAAELLELLHPYHETILDRREQEAKFKIQQAELMNVDPHAVVPDQYWPDQTAKNDQASWAPPATLQTDPHNFLQTAFGRPVTIVGKPMANSYSFAVQGLSPAQAADQIAGEMKQHGVAFDTVTADADHVRVTFAPESRGIVDHLHGRPPVPNARLAPDGHWYVQRNGTYFRVDE